MSVEARPDIGAVREVGAMELQESDERKFSIGLSHGGDLLFSLYVRDHYRLNPAMTPQLTPADPVVFPQALERDPD